MSGKLLYPLSHLASPKQAFYLCFMDSHCRHNSSCLPRFHFFPKTLLLLKYFLALRVLESKRSPKERPTATYAKKEHFINSNVGVAPGDPQIRLKSSFQMELGELQRGGIDLGAGW